MGDNHLEAATKWFEDLQKKGEVEEEGRGSEFERLVVQGLQIVRAQKGYFLFKFIVPETSADKKGNWHVGAIAALIDSVGATVVLSSVGLVQVSVAFDISYFSTVKINEEVEIEARVLGHKGKLSSKIVEIRKTENGEMVAMGKQWMSSYGSLNNLPSNLQSRL